MGARRALTIVVGVRMIVPVGMPRTVPMVRVMVVVMGVRPIVGVAVLVVVGRILALDPRLALTATANCAHLSSLRRISCR